MVNEPYFSFLTTAYRTEQYLPATIESVLAQTRPDWEMVIVDNGNSDEMALIIERYASRDDRIRMVRQENAGYRGGVAAAARLAQGRFVCVLDSDDQLMPEFCERIEALLDSDGHIDAVTIDAVRFAEPEHVDLPVGYMRSIGVRMMNTQPSHRITVSDVLAGKVPYYTAAIRREAWDAVGGYDPGIDDVDESVLIWCRLAARYDVRMLPDRLARYRLRSDSLSRDSEQVEAFERQLKRSFVAGAEEVAAPIGRRALERTLRRLNYQHAIRRSRDALRRGNVVVARREAGAAFTQRHTARAAAILLAVTIAPGASRRIHSAKQKLTSRIEVEVGRFHGRRRPGRA